LRDGDAQRYGGKGVLKAVENVNGEIADAVTGLDATMIDLDGTPNKAEAGRQRHARRSRWPCPRRRRSLRPAPLPLPRRRRRQDPARAHAQHPQRRQARRQHRRLPGVHDPALGLRHFHEALRCRRRDLPHPQEGPQEAGMSTAVGDEGGFAPDLKDNEDALKVIEEAVEGRLQVGRADLRRPRPRHQRAVERGPEGRQEGLQVLQE
jgi:enolase